MKTKIIVLLILVLVAGLPLKALAEQEQHGFAAGSLIIPMDDFYQPADDGGALEAYGLVYYLLDYKNEDCEDDCGTDTDCVETCGITIYWVIDENKTKIYNADLQIVADDDALAALVTDAVVMQNDRTGGSSGASRLFSCSRKLAGSPPNSFSLLSRACSLKVLSAALMPCPEKSTIRMAACIGSSEHNPQKSPPSSELGWKRESTWMPCVSCSDCTVAM